jgi:hypothetical protein
MTKKVIDFQQLKIWNKKKISKIIKFTRFSTWFGAEHVDAGEHGELVPQLGVCDY